MFKKLLLFTGIYFAGALLLWVVSSSTNIFHFSAPTYAVAFFLGLWEEEWENRI